MQHSPKKHRTCFSEEHNQASYPAYHKSHQKRAVSAGRRHDFILFGPQERKPQGRTPEKQSVIHPTQHSFRENFQWSQERDRRNEAAI